MEATTIIYTVLLQRYGIQPTQSLNHYIDNEGVVDLLNQEELAPDLNSHLESDIDMYFVIHHIIH